MISSCFSLNSCFSLSRSHTLGLMSSWQECIAVPMKAYRVHVCFVSTLHSPILAQCLHTIGLYLLFVKWLNEKIIIRSHSLKFENSLIISQDVLSLFDLFLPFPLILCLSSMFPLSSSFFLPSIIPPRKTTNSLLNYILWENFLKVNS